MDELRLNLGSGPKVQHLPGFVNVDRLPDADCRLNVGRDAWPWGSGTVEEIRADNLLEHLDNNEFMHAMNEAHRVLSAKGFFWFKVPDALNWPDGAMGDPTHKRFFVPRSFLYFDGSKDQWKNYGRHYGFLPWVVTLRRDGRFFEARLTKP